MNRAKLLPRGAMVCRFSRPRSAVSRQPAAWEAAVNRRTGNPPHVRVIAELAAIGWRITELRPERLDGRVVLWHVAIARVDDVATMTACASDPGGALAELVCYTAADAKERTR